MLQKIDRIVSDPPNLGSASNVADERFMQRALQLARRGWQRVSPNPMVGAVLVRAGCVIGEGYHRRCGGPHAEVEALRAAGDARGADLYVTLEPCGHHGRTPPCADAVAAAGVARVFYAVGDPHKVTRGRGARALRAHGIEVAQGLCAAEAKSLNAPFFHWAKTGRPWVILKWAMTLDGKVATTGGESRWITGDRAREHAHRLRRRVDAVLVGTDTARIDDPCLTARPARARHAARVVLDRRGRLPFRLQLLGPPSDDIGPGRRFYVTTRAVAQRRGKRLAANGVEVLVVPTERSGLRLSALWPLLGQHNISQVLVEGGPRLLGSCMAAGAAHEAAVYIAPRVAGGERALTAVGGPGVKRLAETPWLESPRWCRLGEDYLVQGRLGRRGR